MTSATLKPLSDVHGDCATHELAWKMTCSEVEELRAWSRHRCAICGSAGHRFRGQKRNGLATDHDQRLGRSAIRGSLCPRCNSYLGLVDTGRIPIDDVIRGYLMNPWYAVREGRAPLPDPVVGIRAADLPSEDISEMQRLYGLHGRPKFMEAIERVSYIGQLWRERQIQPRITNPKIAAALAVGNARPLLRVMWSIYLWGRPDLDVAEVSPSVPGWNLVAKIAADRIKNKFSHLPVAAAPDGSAA